MTKSLDVALIRYRIEKRLAGRRDLLLHLLVYISVAVFVALTFDGPRIEPLLSLGIAWTIPLVLHALRYFYRSGPGARRRADEMAAAIDEQGGAAALDEDEELLIEERVSKRVLARRLIARPWGDFCYALWNNMD